MAFSEHALTDPTLCVAAQRFSFSQMCRKGQTSARRQYIVVNLHPYISGCEDTSCSVYVDTLIH